LRPHTDNVEKTSGAQHPANKGAAPNIWGRKMRVTTLETIASRVVEETLGAVRGTALWSRRILKNKTVGLRAMEHMTMDDVSNGLADAREAAEAKMIISAEAMGADAIVGLRMQLIELGNDTFQAIAFGTAVKTSAIPQATPTLEAPVVTMPFAHAANDKGAVVVPFMPRRVAAH
jgi:uncharacterized protein YbjQ (UPF0145 family)